MIEGDTHTFDRDGINNNVTDPKLFPIVRRRKWNTSLCGCFNDCDTCCISFFFPCWQFGINTRELGLGVFCDSTGTVPNTILYFLCIPFLGMAHTLATVQRAEVRDKYGIRGSLLGDFCASLFCLPCTLSQVSREIRLHEPLHVSTLPKQVVFIPIKN